MSAALPTAVLVHGLWHGPDAWDAVRTGLDARGIDSVAVELPMQSLDGDAAVVRSALDAAGPAVLVGHSYGGAVITVAGEHPAVRALAYIAAFVLDATESISRVAPEADVPATDLGSALRFSDDGAQVLLDPHRGRAILYGDTPAEIADTALSRLRPVSRALFSARPAATAWRRRPGVYAICTLDRCVAPDLQRIMAARVGEQIEWRSDHSPAAAHPDLVADLVERQVRAAG